MWPVVVVVVALPCKGKHTFQQGDTSFIGEAAFTRQQVADNKRAIAGRRTTGRGKKLSLRQCVATTSNRRMGSLNKSPSPSDTRANI